MGERGPFPQITVRYKKIVLVHSVGALEVLLKNNVSTNYVTDCSLKY